MRRRSRSGPPRSPSRTPGSVRRYRTARRSAPARSSAPSRRGEPRSSSPCPLARRRGRRGPRGPRRSHHEGSASPRLARPPPQRCAGGTFERERDRTSGGERRAGAGWRITPPTRFEAAFAVVSGGGFSANGCRGCCGTTAPHGAGRGSGLESAPPARPSRRDMESPPVWNRRPEAKTSAAGQGPRRPRPARRVWPPGLAAGPGRWVRPLGLSPRPWDPRPNDPPTAGL